MNKPLVSVIVVTYNSDSYIIDTLESIKKQSYDNIELVVTDDASKDQTVTYVKKWMKNNKHEFKNVKLICAKQNTGIVQNCNRGVMNSSGEFIKLVGGDDKLLENCIEDNVKFMSENDFSIVLSRYSYIGNRSMINEMEKSFKRNYNLLKSNNQNQLRKSLVEKFALPVTTCFYKKKLWEDMGGYDKRLPFYEDVPFFYKLISKEIDIGFFDKKTYEYNVHESSISHEIHRDGDISYAAYMFWKDHIGLFFLYKFKLLIKYKKYKKLKYEFKKLYLYMGVLLKYHLQKIKRIIGFK